MPNSHSMEIISKCVNKFIKEMVKIEDEKHITVDEANKISVLIQRFNKIVEAKRREIKQQLNSLHKEGKEKED